MVESQYSQIKSQLNKEIPKEWLVASLCKTKVILNPGDRKQPWLIKYQLYSIREK